MNVLERGQDFVKEVTELNRSAVSQFVDIQRDSLKSYVAANRDRFAALREVKDVNAFLDAQRHYYSALQENVKESVRKQAGLAKSNFQATRDLVRNLVTNSPENVASDAEEVQAAAKESTEAVKSTLEEVTDTTIEPVAATEQATEQAVKPGNEKNSD